MFDPKRIYEDRTPEPLKDAPRDASTRPTFTPERIKVKKNIMRGNRKGGPKARIERAKMAAWCHAMEDRFGPKWRSIWRKFKARTGRKFFDPTTDDMAKFPSKYKLRKISRQREKG